MENAVRISDTNSGSRHNSVDDLGSSISDQGDDRSLESDSVKDLSANLRASLENA